MFHKRSLKTHSIQQVTIRALIPLLFIGLGLWFGCLALAESPGESNAPNATHTVCASGCDFDSIQTAIDTVSPGDTLSLGGETFTETFTVNKSLTIQGAGAGSTIVQAAAVPGIASSRVVTVQPNVNVTLDSLTIRYGNANGAGYDGYGGAILNKGTLTITHSSLYSNTAQYYGGGINNDGYARTARLVLISSEVISNTAINGGGIYNDSYNPLGIAQVIIVDSRIAANSAMSGGGIMNTGSLASQAILSITDSEIDKNYASQNGGGLMNLISGANATVNITRSVVAENLAVYYGGGLYNRGVSSGQVHLEISSSAIRDNSTRYGGGLHNSSESSGWVSVSIAQSTISGNAATNNAFASGGGIHNSSATTGTVSVEIEASTITSNTAIFEGGGIRNTAAADGTTSTTFSFSTLSGNTASGAYGAGGAIRNYQASLILLGNIIADSAPDVDCYNALGTVNDQGYNIVEDDINCISAGTSFSADPVLGPLQDNGGSTWTQALQAGSPALDAIPAGACSAAADQRGVPRPQGSGCDIGAYEALTESWVDDDWQEQSDVDAYDPTLTWGVDAFDTIRQGVKAIAGGTVHVLTGTFTESLTLDKNVTVIGEAGAEGTIVQAAGAPGIATSRVITVSGGVSVTLEGLTIRYGRALNGGGIINQGALTVSHTTIVSNAALLKGGGIYAYHGGPDSPYLTIMQSTILDNYSNQDGAGIYNEGGGAPAYLSVQQSTVANNTAAGNGGGLLNNGTAGSALATMENSTFSGNSAQAGGGIGNNGASAALTMTLNTFSNNGAATSGGGLGNLNGTVTLAGSILANSTGGDDCASNNTITNGGGNLVEDGSCGFASGGDPALGPLQDNGGSTWTHALRAGSPALDAIPAGSCPVTIDQRGIARPKGNGCDIGAYEAVTEAWVDDDWQSQADVDAYDPDLVWGEDAFRTVGQGLEAVVGSTVHVLGGTYTEALTIDKSVEIVGEEGAENTIIQAANAPGIAASRVITINRGITVTIDGLTVRYGVASTASGYWFDGLGGGIHNRATFTLTNSIVSSNTASVGGGIYNDCDNSFLTTKILSSTIANNTSSGDGGGIYNDGEDGYSVLFISGSSIVANTASSSGGGIYNSGDDGGVTVEISRSTLSGNQASVQGGGMYSSNHGAITVAHSTIADNLAGTGGGLYQDAETGQIEITISHSSLIQNVATTGGGLYNYGENGIALATISQSTFSENAASNGGAILNNGGSGTGVVSITHSTLWGNSAASNGGGIYTADATFAFSNTIIAGSPGGDCTQTNSTIVDDGYNLVQDGSCLGAPTSFAADPKLGALQDNGSPATGVGGQDPMLTHALLPGSPAIDTIPTALCAAPDDQRDSIRPVGLGCDSGAYELDTFSLGIEKSVDDANPDVGQTITFTIVLNNAGPGTDGARIGDALPAGLNFTGPISLDPPDAGSVGLAPPTLASGLVISTSQRLTVTFSVTVSYGLAGNLQIVNTAAVSSTQVLTPVVGSVTITVANMPPLAGDDGGAGFGTDEDTAFTTGNVLGNDTDLNNDDLSVVGLDTTGTSGLVTDNGDGTFDYDPNGQFDYLAAGEQATDTFNYTVSDGQGGADTATVTITIDGVDDEPAMHRIFLPIVAKNW